jgi:predicted glycosyltransferase
VRAWIDITAPAHVLVFRPLIAILVARGWSVEITARQYTQTVDLLRLHEIDAELIGSHGGRSRLGKLRALGTRLPELRSWARQRQFDVALAHGSHELTLAARSLGIPSATTFDYEFAALQHHLGCRAATRVVVPEAIPPARLASFGVDESKLRRYAGLKEEYYLADFQPSETVFESLGVDRTRVVVVVRTPPDVALYHRRSNPLFPQLLDRLGRDDGVHAVVVIRTEEQRDFVRSLRLPSLIVPPHAVDAQSLIALSDLVISAGGTMNREAAALGVPVYTTYGGRLGGVDESLIRDGRLRPLTDPRALQLVKRDGAAGGVRRDPAVMLDLLLSALPAESPQRSSVGSGRPPTP